MLFLCFFCFSCTDTISPFLCTLIFQKHSHGAFAFFFPRMSSFSARSFSVCISCGAFLLLFVLFWLLHAGFALIPARFVWALRAPPCAFRAPLCALLLHARLLPASFGFLPARFSRFSARCVLLPNALLPRFALLPSLLRCSLSFCASLCSPQCLSSALLSALGQLRAIVRLRRELMVSVFSEYTALLAHLRAARASARCQRIC